MPPLATTAIVVLLYWSTGSGVAVNEEMTGPPTEPGFTARLVERDWLAPVLSVTYTVTEKVPEFVGVHWSVALLDEEHPYGRP